MNLIDKMKIGQMKIQQTAFMLIAVTLFFVLVGIFVLVFKFSDLRQSATGLEEENAMVLAAKLADSPEFSCGESFSETKINCVDADKVMALKDDPSYLNFFGVSNIEIRKIYPLGNEICNSENYPDCDIIRIYDEETSGFDVSNFVSLCRKSSVDGEIYARCELAKIIVGYEKK